MVRLHSVTNIMQVLHSVTNIPDGRGRCWVMMKHLVVNTTGNGWRVAKLPKHSQGLDATHYRIYHFEMFLHLAFNPQKCRAIMRRTTEGGKSRCQDSDNFKAETNYGASNREIKSKYTGHSADFSPNSIEMRRKRQKKRMPPTTFVSHCGRCAVPSLVRV